MLKKTKNQKLLLTLIAGLMLALSNSSIAAEQEEGEGDEGVCPRNYRCVYLIFPFTHTGECGASCGKPSCMAAIQDCKAYPFSSFYFE